MLTWVLAAGAAACVIYFIVIVLYAGIGTGFAGAWLAFAAFLGLSAAGTYFGQKYPGRVPLRVPVTLVTLCGAGALILLVLQIIIFGNIPRIADSSLDYVIVLGSKPRPDGSMTKTLKLRLDKAAEYVMQNPQTRLILSGGSTVADAQPEAVLMKEYLLEKGIPDPQMLLEIQSQNTVENIAYSRVLITDILVAEREKLKQRHPGEDPEEAPAQAFRGMPVRYPENDDSGLHKPVNIGILTSNFHLFRAMMIAKHQNIDRPAGIAALSDPVLLVNHAVREGLAVLKDRLMGNL